MRTLAIFILCLMGAALSVTAQSLEGNCNPFVAQGTIGPAPMPPVEFNGKGIISFKVGNTGDDDLVWEQNSIENELIVTVRLSRGVPDVEPLTRESALTAIGGNYSSKFSWSYNMEENSFTGRQVQTIPGRGVDFVTIGYRVTQNSDDPENGFLVTLTPPAYTAISNTRNDDQVSSYTWTELRDYGDAPESYGLAYHKIQENPDFRIYLGLKVEGEILTANTAAGVQDGDDFLVVRSSAEANTDDDDDGVIIPDLYRGSTATISVTASGQGYLNGWIDWNGDGDFLDAGEQIAVDQLVNSATATISVAVPAGTPAEMVTYARFRFGPKSLTPTGGTTFGEVEDYLVNIKVALPDLTVNLTASINIMEGTTPFCVYLKITELNKVNTAGTIRVIMPRDSRWTIDGDFDTSLTLLENFTLNNPDWSLDLSNDNYYIFSTDASISAGEFHQVGFRAMYNPGYTKGVYSITSQLVPGSGGDLSGSNNSDSEKIDYFNK